MVLHRSSGISSISSITQKTRLMELIELTGVVSYAFKKLFDVLENPIHHDFVARRFY